MTYPLKQGEQVRLKAELSVSESNTTLEEGTRGQILHVDDQGYTVVFVDHITPVAYLTDQHIELAVEEA